MVVSILLYGYTTWTLAKRMEKKLDGNYARMLRAILNKSWSRHPTKQQLYSYRPPTTKTIRVRWSKHAGHSRRNRDELISDVLLWTPSHGRAKAGRPSRTYVQQLWADTGYNPPLKTCWKQWTIGRGDERGLRISMLMVRRDEDDEAF